jgi:hypothetical protein
VLASVLLLNGCNAPGTSSPGAVSEGEARALDEAAEMLDERRLPDGVLPETGAPEAQEQPDAAPQTADEVPAE